MNNQLLDAFSNKVRLKLILCLSEDRKNVKELIGDCGLSQSAVSQHLTKLKKSGIVNFQKEGRNIYYSLSQKRAAKIVNEFKKLELEIKKGGDRK